MKILSLFDGMACGMLAMRMQGVEVDRYVAYEIDKYAVKTAQHNFPMIEEKGDVFTADFTEYQGFDFLVGGSPCTYWSIAQSTDKRETTASGLGWELFSQYLRALHEAKPKYFIYENNKSMSKAIRDSIREAFGFEEICINSALVSAQNRQRYYWVGKRNEDGTYSKVEVKQPEDRGILLKDVLDSVGAKELTEREMEYMVRQTKGSCLTANISKGVPYNVCCEPVCSDGDKSKVLTASYYKYALSDSFKKANPRMGVAEPVRVGTYPGSRCPECDSKQYRIYSPEGKAVTQCGQGGGLGAKTGLYAVPVSARCRGRIDKNGNGYAKYECREDEKANTLDTNTTNGSMAAEPIPQYAIPTEWSEDGSPIKARSGADGKEYTVYQVKGGQITIKGKTYPIKLIDGFWIIRKLTVSECKRLQTVPEWYEFPVSNTQAYKMLGNGWTVEVIVHLIKACITSAS